MKLVVKKNGNLLILAFFFGMLASLFNIEQLQWIDELVGICSIVYIIYYCVAGHKGLNKFASGYAVWMIAMILFGFVGNLLHYKYSYGIVYVLEDAFLFAKPFIIFLATYLAVDHQDITSYVFNAIRNLSRYLVYFVFACLVFSYATNNSLMLSQSDWVPIPQLPFFVFFVGRPAPLAATVGVMYLLFLTDLENNKYRVCRIMCIFILFFAQSGMGYGILLLGIFVALFKLKRPLKRYSIVLIILVVIIIEWKDLSSYLLSGTAARSVLFGYSFKILKRFFPFGSGFSTYGGTIAGHQYAKLYMEYGFDKVWGLTPVIDQENNFLYDTYYPQVLAQLGAIGTITFVGIFVYWFKAFNNLDGNQSMRGPLLYGIFSIIIMNTGQGAFGGLYGMLIMVAMAVTFRMATVKEKKEDYVYIIE